jgi:hypothetical protein
MALIGKRIYISGRISSKTPPVWDQVSTAHPLTDVYVISSASTSTGATVLSEEMLSLVVNNDN